MLSIRRLLTPTHSPTKLLPPSHLHPHPFRPVGTKITPLPTQNTPNDYHLDSKICHGVAFDTHRMITSMQRVGLSRQQAEVVSDALVGVTRESSKASVENLVTKSEFASLRSELQILEKADFALLKSDIQLLEKKLDTSTAEVYTSVERVENRVIKYVIGVAGTAAALGLGFMRVTKSPPPPPAHVPTTVQGQGGGGEFGGGRGVVAQALVFRERGRRREEEVDEVVEV